jgi:hypothetical protein
LHADERIKLFDPPSLPEPIGLLQVSLPVYREGMVYGSYYWYVQFFHQEKPIAKALIVVNNVKAALSAKLFQLGMSPEAKCPRLGENSQAAGAKFMKINEVPDFGEILPEGASRMIYA